MHRLARIVLLLVAATLLATAASASSAASRRDGLLPIEVFYDLGGEDEGKALASLDRIGRHWDNAYAAPLLDLLPFIAPGPLQRGMVAQLEKASGRSYGGDLNGWYEWLWSIDPGTHPDYAQ